MADVQMIAGRFPRPVAKRLKRLAVDEDKTLQDLLGEALDLLFVSRGMDRIGEKERASGD